MLRWARTVFAVTTLSSLAVTVAGRAATPSSSTLSLANDRVSWQGAAPWPNPLSCQPSDPTCDHHVITVGAGVNPADYSVAIDVAVPGAHVAVYRIDGTVRRVDITPLGQTIVASESTNLTAIASTTSGERLVFNAEPGQYDVAVGADATPAAPQAYTARASLCAGTACSA